MQKIDTGSVLIHRYDDALNSDICGRLCELISSRAGGDRGNNGKLPWQDSDTYSLAHWDDPELVRLISAYRIMVAQIICLNFRRIVFPHFTDLVLWRPGRSMAEHKDDGYAGEEHVFGCRHFSAITYCNDGYGGGETFIRNEHGGHYLATPRCGTLVFYPSDARCAHGVNEVRDQDRITLSTWYTRDVDHYRPERPAS